MAEVEKKKKRTFCKFPSHGIDLRPLLDLFYEQPMQLYSAPQQQGLNRALRREQHSRLKRLCEAKKEALPLEEPEVVKTHLRDMIVLPEMEGAYNDKTFTQVEIKPELIGHYLGECSMTYKPAKHHRLVSGPTPPASFPSSSLLGN